VPHGNESFFGTGKLLQRIIKNFRVLQKINAQCMQGCERNLGSREWTCR